MDRMTIKSRVGADGVLHLNVPVGEAIANREVQVTIEPVGQAVKRMTREEWRDFILQTAGTWQGDFERPEQGEYEQRDEL